MSFFNGFKQKFYDYLSNENGTELHRWLSLVVLVLLLTSTWMAINVLRLQQEIRQRATNSCMVEKADCSNQSGKSCCSGLMCVIKNSKAGTGKCESIPVPTPTTYAPPTSSETPDATGGTENGIGSPVAVQCGPNGCGWSPRPEGEKSTTDAPAVQVCTMSFTGPTQLIGTRLSSTSIRFNWWPSPGGADKQFISYGLESGKALWGLINIRGDQGQLVVDNLPADRIIWAQVRAYKGNCYEDTSWISVGPFNHVANAPTIPEQTNTPSPTITVVPTSISVNSAFYFAASADPNHYDFMQSLVEFLLFFALLFFFLFLLLKVFRFFWRRKQKHKKKE